MTMPNTREKLIELPIDDAILILREELKQRTDGYTEYLAHGGKGDPAEEANLDALAMAISALEQTKWISVKDRLPDETKDEYVLVVCDYHGKIKVETRKMWHIDSVVTHWMPLPEPPKGE